MSQVADLSGQRFGRLVAVKRKAKTKQRSFYWECRCDCGAIATPSIQSLRSGNTKSCGCLQKELTSKRHTGVKPSNVLKEGEANFNSLYYSYTKRAKRKKLLFELSKSEFKEITKQNCFYCKSIPSQKHNLGKRNGAYIYNGIDRVDNSIGYIYSNCKACCKFCNRAKDTMTIESFLQLVKSIYVNFF
jgi:hypothetical protein